MSTNHTPICVADDHDYTIINIRQMNGHQTPLIKCERCDTVWHNHTPARHGDLIFIPTHEPPTDEHLTAISELANKTGVMILFVDTEPTIHPQTLSHLAKSTEWLHEETQIRAVTGCDHTTAVSAQILSKIKGYDHDTFIKALIESASTDPHNLARSLPNVSHSCEAAHEAKSEPTHAPYDQGDLLLPGFTHATNTTGHAEPIRTHNPGETAQENP